MIRPGVPAPAGHAAELSQSGNNVVLLHQLIGADSGTAG
jgi:hypothetical protein